VEGEAPPEPGLIGLFCPASKAKATLETPVRAEPHTYPRIFLRGAE
jgi:hypothetical protein